MYLRDNLQLSIHYLPISKLLSDKTRCKKCEKYTYRTRCDKNRHFIKTVNTRNVNENGLFRHKQVSSLWQHCGRRRTNEIRQRHARIEVGRVIVHSAF